MLGPNSLQVPRYQLKNGGPYLYSLPLDGRRGTSILDQNYVMFLFKLFEKIAEQVSYHVIDVEAIQFIANVANVIGRF